MSLPTSLSGGVQRENKSFPSVGLHVRFWRRPGEFCQLSGTNRCQHLFRYRLGNSPCCCCFDRSFGIPPQFASPPASLSVTSACCLLGLKMRVSRIKSSEKKNPTALHCTDLYLCQNFYLIIAISGHVSGIHCVLLRCHKRFCEYCVIITNCSAHAAVCGTDFVHLFLNLCHF